MYRLSLKITLLSKELEIYQLLEQFDDVFDPSITSRISNLKVYTSKLFKNGLTYVIQENDHILGFISMYANDIEKKEAYIIFLAVAHHYQGNNLGEKLLDHCIQISTQKGMKSVRLEVQKDNQIAIRFYQKHGFKIIEDASKKSLYMENKLKESDSIG